MAEITKANLAGHYPVIRQIINISCTGVIILFLYSLQAPLFTLEKFYFFDNTVSVAGALKSLLDEQQLALFIVIFVFSILFPIFKIAVMLLIWNIETGVLLRKFLAFIHAFGKWSMLDVFVVALMIVSIKLGALANMHLHYGLYFFMSAVVLTMVLSFISSWYLERHFKQMGSDVVEDPPPIK